MAIPWIPLLSFGASLLGAAAGKTSSTNQSGNENTIGSSAQTTQQDGKTNQTQSQTSNQTSNETATGSTAESVNRLDSTTKDMLTQQVQDLLSTAGRGSAAINSQLDSVMTQDNNFDPAAFVGGVMTQARSAAASDLESGVNAIGSRTGVSGNSNSAAALLKTKATNQTSANLAGIEADATAKGAQIKQGIDESKTNQIGSLSSGANGNITTLLNGLLNATQTQTGSTTQNTAGTTAANTNTVSNETTSQQQNTAGTTKQNTTTNQNQNTQENDWDKFFSGISGAFKTTF